MTNRESGRAGGGHHLICFSGIDGSGKTTLAKRTVDWLESEGVRSRYIWNIFEPWLLAPFLKLGRAVFLRKQNMFRDYSSYAQSRQRIFRVPGISSFFHFCFFGEYLVRFTVRVRFWQLRGRTVVCDRYVYDAVATHAANVGYSHDKVRSTINRLLRLMPKPDLVLFVDIPEELAWERKDDVPSIEFLQKRRKVYLQLVDEYAMEVIDGSRSLAELEEGIRERVNRLLGIEAGSDQLAGESESGKLGSSA